MNVISIHKKAILSNYDFLQTLQPHAEIFPVLKSNAYGHGLKQMVKILRKTDAPYLVVDSFPEYQIVKKYSNKQILLLGETLLENYRNFNFHRVTFCVYNKKTITTLGEIGKDINVHLFFNTGMNREGIQEDQLVDILEEIKKFPTITVEGVMSHLYSADEIEYDGIEEQIKKFRTMYYKLVDYGHAPTWRHIGNSAGIFKINDDFFNAFRPGISLYGYSPFASHAPLHKKAKPLKPALSVSSRVISTQIARPGEGVSYNHTYKPYDRELCATIPFGYGEGLPRAASGKLMMKCGRQWIKQIGTICMNLCTCKSDAEVAIGDKVEIISNAPDAKNSMDQLAQASETIVYECLVRLDKSIRREII